MRSVPAEEFGRDHWSTMAHIAFVITDKEGQIDIRKMRCNGNRHPHFSHAGGWEKTYATILRDHSMLDGHDDWDCLMDLVGEGFLHLDSNLWPHFQNKVPKLTLTERGASVAAALRNHQKNGGTFGNFTLDVDWVKQNLSLKEISNVVENSNCDATVDPSSLSDSNGMSRR